MSLLFVVRVYQCKFFDYFSVFFFPSCLIPCIFLQMILPIAGPRGAISAIDRAICKNDVDIDLHVDREARLKKMVCISSLLTCIPTSRKHWAIFSQRSEVLNTPESRLRTKHIAKCAFLSFFTCTPDG